MSKEYGEWIRDHRLYHLCIRDLEKFKPGDVIDVAIFDRNMEEYGMWDDIRPDTPLKAKEFFRFNHHQIRIIDNNNWILIMDGEEFDFPLHYNLKKDGTIRIKNEIINSGEQIPHGRKKFKINVSDLHPLTRVGWRGPVMLWKYVQESKVQVIWTRK